jgi:hypothetical protein
VRQRRLDRRQIPILMDLRASLSGLRSWLKPATPVALLTESNPDSDGVNGPAQDRDVSFVARLLAMRRKQRRIAGCDGSIT